jgi:hypothetical protein
MISSYQGDNSASLTIGANQTVIVLSASNPSPNMTISVRTSFVESVVFERVQAAPGDPSNFNYWGVHSQSSGYTLSLQPCDIRDPSQSFDFDGQYIRHHELVRRRSMVEWHVDLVSVAYVPWNRHVRGPRWHARQAEPLQQHRYEDI